MAALGKWNKTACTSHIHGLWSPPDQNSGPGSSISYLGALGQIIDPLWASVSLFHLFLCDDNNWVYLVGLLTKLWMGTSNTLIIILLLLLVIIGL